VLKADSSKAPNALDIVLDWQRLYKNPIRVRRSLLAQEFDACTSKALEYFQEVGAGALNYGA
jgi:hypothetical protein